MLTIDGAYGIGSGQLTRFALVFSTLCGEPVEIIHIREGRDSPGLKPQHLHALLALQQLCTAQVEGATLSSSRVVFHPGKLVGGNVKINIGTAGSIPLLLQNLLIPLLFCSQSSTITVTGGTDVFGGPTIDYFSQVILPFFRPYAQEISLDIKTRGYFPKGGGKVVLHVVPKYHRNSYPSFLAFVAALRKLEKPFIRLEQGKILQVFGRSHASDYLEKAHVAVRQLEGARKVLGTQYSLDFSASYSSTLCPGSGITLLVVTDTTILGVDALGEQGKKSEIVGALAAEKLLHEIATSCALDVHATDHVIPLLALLTGKIKTSFISEHTKTALWLIEQFMDVDVLYHDQEISIT